MQYIIRDSFNLLLTIFQGHESFASYESLEQLHRFLFVLATVHVSYSFAAIVLAMIKVVYHARSPTQFRIFQ